MLSYIIYKIFGHKKFIPSVVVKSIFDIDYNKIYDEGCRIILTDLDNTLISYEMNEPNEALINWRDKLQSMGFKIIIVSNSHSFRVSHFSEMINLEYQPSSMKPLKRGFKKVVKKNNIKDPSKVVLFGDQIMTDILGGNRMGFKTFLVEAIDKTSEGLSTRFNRHFEKRIVKYINKKEPAGVLKNYE